ncbi:MAG: CHASE2 domain-containing protein [Candidatus Omnitrophica bacterium]|nr:CHASE2 domain-containing protein [Candidatus Omnitrophota bacterium]
MKFFKKVSPKIWWFSFLVLLIVVISLTNIFASFDLFFYDLFFKLRPKPAVSEKVAIIEITDNTLNKLAAWPLPRDFHASLIEVLGDFGAEAVVFDIIFAEDTFYDQVFSKAIAKEKVYLPIVFYLDGLEQNWASQEAVKKMADIQADIKKSVSGIGHINVFVDSDGKIRRVPLFINFDKKLYPHLGLAAAAGHLNLNLEKIDFRKRKVIVDKKLKIPVGKNSSLFVNFPDKWNKAFPHFSYLEILKSYQDIKRGKKASLDLTKLKGKTCFVGLTAAGTTDLKAVPLEESYPMLGLQASVYNSIINKDFIRQASLFLNLFIALLIFTLVFLITLKFSPIKSLFISLSLLLGFFLAAFLLFSYYQFWVNSFLIFLIISFVYLGAVIVKFLEERKNKQILEKELDIAQKIQNSFLPKEIKDVTGLDLSCYMKPAKFVAGDLYDIIKLDKNKLGIFLADVSGKGASAALIMAQTISIFRILARKKEDPALVLTNLNREISKTLKGKFITAVYIIFDLDKKEINFSSAGHMPPIIYESRKEKAKEIEFEAGIPLGVVNDTIYSAYQRKIDKGDKIIVYTDGITEARNRKGKEFEIEGLNNLLSKYGSLVCREIKEKLIEGLNKFSKKMPQADDITFVITGITE